MQGFRIVALCIMAACIYGIAHDQITARVCVEYFTIGHPRIFETESPTLLGVVWGILATWWVGLLLGVPLALTARVGELPKINARRLVRPILTLLAIMGMSAAVAGTTGYFVASSGQVRLAGSLASRVPPDHHVSFIADLWAHNASYVAGFIGGIVLMVRTVYQRKSERNERREGGLSQPDGGTR
jgi:hypothetical protein